jgi:hypothetical protein
MLNARRASSQCPSTPPSSRDGQPQGQGDDARSGIHPDLEARRTRETMTSSTPHQPSPLGKPSPPPYPPRPPPTPTASTSSSFSSFFTSGLGSKAKSSVSFLASNTKPYRSALASAGSYVASQAGLIPDRSVRGNAEGNEKEKSWGEWARDWRDRRAQEGKAEESLNLLPGWVIMVPREAKNEPQPGEDSGKTPPEPFTDV